MKGVRWLIAVSFMAFGVLAYGVYLLVASSANLLRLDALLSIPSPEYQGASSFAVDTTSFDWVYTWDEPRAQNAQRSWVYDLFTPPTLWRDAHTHQLVSEIPQSILNAQDWGVELISLDRQWYRLQFEGYTDGGPLARGKAKLYFDDRSRGRRVVGYVGSRIPKVGVRVLAFDPEVREVRGLKSGTTPARNPEVVILDEVTGEEIVLKQKDPHYTSRWIARVAIPELGEVRFNETGESYVLGGARVRVDSVDFGTGSITLKREDLTTGKVDYAVLSQ